MPRTGRWKQGQSGNPRGRRPGQRHRITVLAERLMENDASDVVRAVIAAARGGDMAAAKLVLERVIPARRGRPVALKLPSLETSADLVAALASITNAVASGELTPEEGQSVAAILEQQRRAIETIQLEQRIAALEARSA